MPAPRHYVRYFSVMPMLWYRPHTDFTLRATTNQLVRSLYPLSLQILTLTDDNFGGGGLFEASAPDRKRRYQSQISTFQPPPENKHIHTEYQINHRQNIQCLQVKCTAWSYGYLMVGRTDEHLLRHRHHPQRPTVVVAVLDQYYYYRTPQ